MDNQVINFRGIEEKSKTSFTLGIVGMSLAGAYLIEGVFSVLVAVFPTPAILAAVGLLISAFLSLVEFALMVGAFTVNGISLYKALSFGKIVETLPWTPEMENVRKQHKLAKLFAIVGLSCTGGFCLILSVLNVIEFLLLFI